MNLKTLIYIFIIFQNVSYSLCSFTIGVGILGVATSALYASFGKIYCSFAECCTLSHKVDESTWVKRDLRGLRQDLRQQVHGQHLANTVVLKALHAHFSDPNPSKALVMSFHGWTGSGKNHVAQIIAKNLYKKGLKSKYVHLFSSTVHFPFEEKADIYKLQIQDWIRGNISECEHTLFIFDEIDKMPLGMIDAIKPFIDYHEEIFGINFRNSIFIFLSNTGSRDINKKVIEYWRLGKERDGITLDEMEELVLKGAFNERGGLHDSELIKHSLVDYYIPFLPLERPHIEKCIKDQFKKRGLNPTNNQINNIKDSLTYFPPGTNLLSTTGCKRIPQKIGYLLSESVFEEVFN